MAECTHGTAILVMIQQIYRDLNILSNYSPEEREELREGYFRFLDRNKRYNKSTE